LVGQPEGRNQEEEKEMGINYIKMNLRERRWGGVHRIDLAQDTYGHGNELSTSTKRG
jgi:hypothetical protein